MEATVEREIELSAIQMMLLVLISSHPDKTGLLHEFDTFTSKLQTEAAARPQGEPMPQAMRAALDRWREQIRLAVERG